MRLRPNPPGLPHAETRQKSHPEPSKTPPEPMTLLKPSWERLGEAPEGPGATRGRLGGQIWCQLGSNMGAFWDQKWH